MKTTCCLSLACLGLLVSPCLADPAAPGIALADLHCELVPHAVTERAAPRLSWQLRSSERAKTQTAYEILVASDPALLSPERADLWRSDRVASAQSINVPYAGKPLASRQLCYWKARAWDEKGIPSDWSPAATWEMALLTPADWGASQWIRSDAPAPAPADQPPAAERGKMHHPNFPAPLLRKDFTVKGKVRRATAYVCGLGYHELYVNGQRISDEVLAPAPTTYDMRALYVVRDVTAQLHDGSNCVGLWLGNGFYGNNLALGGGLAYGPPLARAVLYLDYEDGRHETLGTDASWQTALSPIRFDNVYWGETFDARQARPGWSEPGHPSEGWTPAAVVSQPPTKRLVVEDLPPIRRLETWTPTAVTPGKNGHWILDFGRNFAGWVRLRDLPTATGQRISLRFAEVLSPDGTEVDPRSTGGFATGADQQEIYVADGTPATWEPRFTYHGFRYAEIDGLTQPPSARQFEAVRVATDLPSAGTFTSADPGLNRIYDTSLWTIRNNVHGLPEDCPHREKCAWLGDAHATGETFLFSLAGERFWTKFCDDEESTLGKERMRVDKTQEPPGLPANIALGKRLCQAARVDWGAAMVLVPWYLYVYDGNTDVATRQYGHMKDWIEYVETRKRDGLVEDGYGDWCPPGSNKLIDTPVNFTSTALQAACAQIMSRLAPVVGHPEDTPAYERIARETRAALIAKFLQPDGGYSTQTENAVALRFGLYPDGAKPKVEAALQHAVFARQNHYGTGIHGSRWLYTGLADAGQADLALQMMRQPDYPSYANTLAQGFTTWPEVTLPTAEKSAAEGSLSHPMQSGFAAFFHEALLGIRPDPAVPGFRHAFLRPEGFAHLAAASGTHRTPYGEITSDWKTDHGTFVWRVVVPPNTTATVAVPAAPGSSVTEHGQPAASSPGVRKTADEPGRAVFELGSGDYEFRSTLP